ncbi:MAG TPA: cupin domain-containing protein [Thermoplasmata archaeon]|nr:cupin domain-containing protein [Thermoplasmata archaeon]
MDAFELAEIERERSRSGEAYREFLRMPSMSCGIYVLAKGARDPQLPHTEDEVYYVIHGHARIRVGQEDRAVQPGSIVFVRAQVEHRFLEISEELELLVFFAPAEGAPSR